jgi:large subunit ribosomal protein L18
MSNIKTKEGRRKRIKMGIRRRIEGTTAVPRLSIFKSNKAIYAQVIDDSKSHTLLSVSSVEIDKKSTVKLETSIAVGKKVAERAIAAGINAIVFDRNGYRYHGNIKALADAAREGGLKF